MSEKTSDDEKTRIDEYLRLLREKPGFLPPDGTQTLWWLSFADDDGFRGACIVPGHDVVSAARAAHLLGCNPGGQVLGHPFPLDMAAAIDAEDVARLLDLAACRACDRKMIGREPS